MNAQGYIITATACVCSLIYNFIFWPWDLPNQDKESNVTGLEMTQLVAKDWETRNDTDTPRKGPSDSMAQLKGDLENQDTSSNFDTTSPMKMKVIPTGEDVNEMQGVSTEMPTVKASIFNCPWAVMPFVYGMFTLVSALNRYGWIAALSTQLLKVIPADEGNSPHAIAISTYLMTTISFVLCCLIDNQPASILLTSVLVDPQFGSLPVNVRRAGMLGVLEGANVGGCWSLMGALAGIMWATLLRNKGVRIGYMQFMKVSLKVMPFVTFVVALIIFAESCNAPG